MVAYGAQSESWTLSPKGFSCIREASGKGMAAPTWDLLSGYLGLRELKQESRSYSVILSLAWTSEAVLGPPLSLDPHCVTLRQWADLQGHSTGWL